VSLPHTTSAPRGPGRPRRSLPRRLAKWLLLLVLGLVLLGAAAFAYGYLTTDIPDPNEDLTAQTSFIYYSDGKEEIGRFASQNRTSVPLSEVPDHVQQAVIAAEDRTFYSNQGVDPKGILRAAFSNARGNSTQGASTITQQYVKVFYLSQERTLTRKVKEAFVSLKLQRQMSKRQILEGYLNTIYFGRGAYGIQAAAQAYFDTNASELTVREGAALAAILNSPSNFDPGNGADARARLLGRYQYVLSGMASAGNIPTARAERLKERLPAFPKIATTDTYGGQRGHLLTMVRKQLLSLGFTDEEISGGGLKVTTTFTRNAMDAAAEAVRDQRPSDLRGLHVAVATVDPATGALRGMFAGQDYLKSQINWATAGSSPGSAFKPFALAAGLDDGYALDSTFQGNSPYVFADGSGEVVNEGPGDGNDYGSAISLSTATEQSVNTAYVDLTESMEDGPQKILDMAVRMGVPRDAPGLEALPGISLGSATISPIDMANGYGTIADGGQAKKWFVVERVTDPDGTRRYTAPKKATRVLPDEHWNWFDSDIVVWRSKAGQTREFIRDLQELRRVVEPAAVRLAAERATATDIAEIEAAYAGMKLSIEEGGDYVSSDLRFHQGLLRACHNRMVAQMSKALGALLRTSFEISTSRPDGPASSLPLHRAVLDAVIARSPQKAERAILVLIDGANEDIEAVLASSHRKLPSLGLPARRLKGRSTKAASTR